MPIFNNILAGSSGQATGYDIDQSLRFEPDEHYLSRAYSSAGNRRTWTVSFWHKVDNLASSRQLFGVSTNATVGNPWPGFIVSIDPTGTSGISIEEYTGSSYNLLRQTANLFRDPSAWYHFVIRYDTTQATDSNRIKIYVNGVEVEYNGSPTYPSQNHEGYFNDTNTHRIGKGGSSNGDGAGYFAEFYSIDGQSLGPESFGETNSATNQWVPIEVTGMTYGTNGFYQKYSATELANSFTNDTYSGETFVPSESLTVNWLVVGGGGASGKDTGGGGGAGGFRTGASHSVSAQSYTITVGAGGAWDSSSPQSGGNSTFDTITSNGGGVGGSGSTSGLAPGATGGSGGGSCRSHSTSGAAAISITPISGETTSVQGYAGGGNNATNGSSGGGGAGQLGDTAGSGGRGGYGGYGIASSITGASVTYAGGGGGAAAGSPWGGAGGAGGGGDSNMSGAGAGTSGTNGLGGGGGGGYSANGASGGSGIVIISYISTTAKATGGTITSYVDGGNTYQVHTFTNVYDDHTITANGDVANSRAQAKIGSSSIKFDGTGDYLSLADSSDWDFSGDFTVEGWFRTNNASAEQTIFGTEVTHTNNDRWAFWMSSGGKLGFFTRGDETTAQGATTLSADTWYHIAAVRSGSTVKLWLNGAEDASFTDGTSLVADGLVVGCWYTGGTSSFMNGYLDELRISNSARYTGAFTPSTTEFTADANTKLLIHSDFDGGLGADSSGNKNDFSAVNLVATDVMTGESPTNNFATLNPLINSSGSPAYSEGNLVITPDGSNYSVYQSTISVTSGKWYAEYLVGDTNTFCGVSSADQSASAYGSYWDNTSADFIFLNNNNGNKIIDGAATSYGTGATVGQIVGVAIDLDGNAINFYVNNSAQGSISFSGGVASASSFVFSGVGYAADPERWNFGQDSSFAGNKTAQGNGGDGEDFYYSPPTGYKALNTDNLDDPAIALPGDYFNTVLYAGNGGTQSVTGAGFSPDFVWIKNRADAVNHGLFDTIRGVRNSLISNATTEARTAAGATEDLYAFGTDGFSVGVDTGGTSYINCNESSKNYASWNWKAGGTAVSNTDGTITSSVSANTTAGFSVVTWTGTGSAATDVGHGLSQSPELIILKNRTSAEAWVVGATPLPTWGWKLVLNTGADDVYHPEAFNGATPSASFFRLGNSDETNEDDSTFVAYCFHSVEGYSKVGSYTGNGVSQDGPFVYCGFKPAFLLVKNQTSTAWWTIFDNKRNPYNTITYEAYPNSNVAEGNNTGSTNGPGTFDFLSNGFKCVRKAAFNESNANGDTYTYLAFAESPFKTSNAR